jgi:hypothetical protein
MAVNFPERAVAPICDSLAVAGEVSGFPHDGRDRQHLVECSARLTPASFGQDRICAPRTRNDLPLPGLTDGNMCKNLTMLLKGQTVSFASVAITGVFRLSEEPVAGLFTRDEG